MEIWPNFFIVGAAKAGTTSLYSYLKENQEIYMSPYKEPHYFSPVLANLLHYDFLSEKEDYLAQFKEVKNEKAIGECSPLYLQDPDTPKLIHETIPNAKIIFSLRDPIERAFSNYLSLWGRGYITIQFKESLKRFVDSEEKDSYFLHSIVEPGFYYESVKRFMEIFGSNQVKIIFFEDFIQYPKKILTEILRFLDVNPELPENVGEIYNPYREPKGQLSLLILRNKLIRKIAKNTISNKTSRVAIKKFLNKEGIKPQLGEEEKKLLKKIYQTDVCRLREFLKRPLPWQFPKSNLEK